MASKRQWGFSERSLSRITTEENSRRKKWSCSSGKDGAALQIKKERIVNVAIKKRVGGECEIGGKET